MPSAGLWQGTQQESFRDVRPGQPNQIGHVILSKSGWKLHYDIAGQDSDEAGFRLEDERFVPGEYISIRDGEKHTRVYKVSTVERY